MGWGFSLRIFIRLFRYKFKLGKLVKYPWNSEYLAFSEGQTVRTVVRFGFSTWKSCCLSVALRNWSNMFATWLIGFGVLQFLVSKQFFPYEPEGSNCCTIVHTLNQVNRVKNLAYGNDSGHYNTVDCESPLPVKEPLRSGSNSKILREPAIE
ncbi:hypothetical protein PIB30_100203 [Stylosanthes scabra]|uniref:Uncharacterized protein n=1 Tax=Stylosanthes scabra TaxID=79078 RepID=A0ABU6YXU7_9FABA|nr:hypothetical protein [Stylosanthes scabra]